MKKPTRMMIANTIHCKGSDLEKNNPVQANNATKKARIALFLNVFGKYVSPGLCIALC
ncbi:MAG: hypothetical protein RQ761_11830 [Bacteroidales bacterium]|nr:hypothetical protein [Bacteroidales bacterium]